MKSAPLSLRQSFNLVWSISSKGAGAQEIKWVRRELSRSLINAITFGLVK
jgi:hypothetical protein